MTKPKTPKPKVVDTPVNFNVVYPGKPNPVEIVIPKDSVKDEAEAIKKAGPIYNNFIKGKGV